MALTDVERKRITDLVHDGHPVRAWRLANEHGSPRAWTDPHDRLCASLLADTLGGTRLGHAMVVCAYAVIPDDLEARRQYAMMLFERRGPLAAWEFLNACPDEPAGADDLTRARWLALHAQTCSIFRDFDAAERWLDRARAVVAEDRTISAQQLFLLQCQDRYDEALALGRTMLAQFPSYAYVVHATTSLMMLQGADREAEALLAESADRYELPTLFLHLYQVQMEFEDYEGAERSLDEYTRLALLREKPHEQWLLLSRSELALRRGDRVEAVRLAEEADCEEHASILSAMREAPEDARRVRLEVPFVRQHHMTCAPATLTAISRFWSKEVDQLAIVEEITYGGTPAEAERDWADRNGFVTREFTVTWDAARALLHRAAPFMLVTTDPHSAHMQAVVGYDEARGTLLIRDPSVRFLREMSWTELLKTHRSVGPRGMALVPVAQAHLIEDLSLPDTTRYDRFHELKAALKRHDDIVVDRLLTSLSDEAPRHYITLHARQMVADYHHDAASRLAACSERVACFPDDDLALSNKVMALDNRGQREERLALVRERCGDRKAHPFFLVECAYLMCDDAREHDTALRLLVRAARRGGRFEPILATTALIYAARGRWEDALRLQRFTVCLDDKHEPYSQAYFATSRHLKQMGRTLAFLEGRFRRFGRKSGQPVRTFFAACEQMDLMSRAFDALEEALVLRPDDGELILFAADVYGRHGNFERADALVAQAAGCAHRRDRLRTTAWLAQYRGEPAEALKRWQRILELEPYAADAHREVAALLAATHGVEVAVAHLQKAVDRTERDYALHQMLIGWIRDRDPEAWADAARRLIEIVPGDLWAHRELAFALRQLQRLDEALEEAEFACRMDERDAFSFALRGLVETSLGNVSAAQASFRKALSLSVDLDWAITELMGVCHTAEARREALLFVREQLVEQVIFGDGLLAWRECACGVLDDATLLRYLTEALDARDDLWHAWSAMVLQLTTMGKRDEALTLSRKAAERFPLLPRIWIDRAEACRVAGDAEGEIEALEKAFEITPQWGQAVRLLSSAYERRGDWEASRALLTRAVSGNPLDPLLHSALADTLWRLERRDEALARIERALQIEPAYTWAWERYETWTTEMRCPERVEALARDNVKRRPHAPDAWMTLAAMLADDHFDERLAALDRAIELDARNEEAHDRKARLLASVGRVEQALEACRPPAWPEGAPARLRSTAAWVLLYFSRPDEALELLKALAKEEPANPNVWRQITNAYRYTNQRKLCLDAAKKLVEVSPTDPGALVCLGNALVDNNKGKAALEAYGKAFELDPTYPAAGLGLIDVYLGLGDYGPAGMTLKKLAEHAPGPAVASRQVMLEAGLGNLGGARKALASLCRMKGEEAENMLPPAVHAFVQHGWQRELEDLASEAIEEPHCNNELGSAWMQAVLERRGAAAAEKVVVRVLPYGEVGLRAADALLNMMDQRVFAGRAARFIRQNADALKRDVRLWGAAGFALITQGDNRGALRWLSDWRTRADVLPWMLINLQTALRARGNDREATRVSEAALALPPDHTTRIHRLWVAFVQAIDGRHGEAARHIEQTPDQGLAPVDRMLLFFTRAVLDLARDPRSRENRRRSNRWLKSALQVHRGIAQVPPHRRAHRRCLRALRRLRGGIGGRLWWLIKWMRS